MSDIFGGDVFSGFGDLFGGKQPGADFLQETLKNAEIEGQLTRWFHSRAGQHVPKCGFDVKGDLLRFKGNSGLPTIRGDLAHKLDKVEHRGEKILAMVRKRLTESQKIDLRRLAPPAPKKS